MQNDNQQAPNVKSKIPAEPEEQAQVRQAEVVREESNEVVGLRVRASLKSGEGGANRPIKY